MPVLQYSGGTYDVVPVKGKVVMKDKEQAQVSESCGAGAETKCCTAPE